ncbi:MAG: CehA/McbA family metallohydrolase [Planctomycetes bacterium]|nr:CehA/McbA family metallohydrolase [Planctomycetota bacterium]MCP4769876.1 CehA/McbA family metallohydrolase [Planctomycetota bacterium]MCP4859716.1 CehA/McbA family metallohydrolase [Planctomycetota bacterium]
MQRLLIPLVCAAGLGIGLLTRADAGATTIDLGPSQVEILPFGLLDEVRRADLVVPMQVQIYNSGAAGVELVDLVIQSPEGDMIGSRTLDNRPLAGDHGFLNDLYLEMERTDPDFSHRHTKRLFIPLEDYEPLGPEGEAEAMRRVLQGVADLKQSGAPQIYDAQFDVDLAALFGPDAQVGDVAPFEIVVTWFDGSQQQSNTLLRTITMLAPFRPAPAGHWSYNRGVGSWVTGDLHVHNCRDEAINGCDSCAAESVNITGAFTNAQLKPQFQALGFDFFSSTTHSYCINSDTEFDAVLAESVALTDPGFVMLAGTEVSGLETGPQSGSDSSTALCLLGFSSNEVHHMGAHHITSRKPGGRQGFLDFCDDPLLSQGANYNDVNSEGGFTVINHPASSMWGFNSLADLTGQERNNAWGVEVWNGSEGANNFQTFQRNWWVERMVGGKLLYPYSGSDTHDSAHNFGATHTFVSGALNGDSLNDALKSGLNYLSNGPFLDISISDNGGRGLGMGEVLSVRGSLVPNNYPITVSVPYNVDQNGSTIDIYRGVVGVGEVLVSSQSGITGSGTLNVGDSLPNRTCWYRAEVRNTTLTESALTTPVFVHMF